jgi:hypothetical protein
MANIIIKWLIGVMMIVFAIIFVSAGMKLVTSGGNPAAKTDAKEKLTNAIIGLIIVLAGWLLVDTLMRALLKGGTGQINGVMWTTVTCQSQAETTLKSSTPSGGTPPPASGGTGLSEADALKALSSAGISVLSSGGCTDPTNKSCTGVAGMQQSTVDNIVAISSACSDCGIVMTAGTEVGHTNACHQAGTCADVDCRPNDCTVSQINTIDSTASSNGLNAVYEVKTEARKAELISAGVDPKAVSVVSWITGEHFSLYGS